MVTIKLSPALAALLLLSFIYTSLGATVKPTTSVPTTTTASPTPIPGTSTTSTSTVTPTTGKTGTQLKKSTAGKDGQDEEIIRKIRRLLIDLKEDEGYKLFWTLSDPLNQLERVLEAIPGDGPYFSRATRFVSKLPAEHIYYRAVGWQKLLELHKKTNNGHVHFKEILLKWSYAVWNDLEKYNKEISVDEKTSQLFQSLARQVPEQMARMLWGSRCTIKDINTGYLLAVSVSNDQLGAVSSHANHHLAIIWWKLEPNVLTIPGTENDLLDFHFRSLNWQGYSRHPYLSLNTTTPDNEDASMHYKTGFISPTQNVSDILTGWIVEPLTSKKGEVDAEGYEIYSFNKNFTPRYLFVGDGQENQDKRSGRPVVIKAVDYSQSDTPTRNFWKIDCE